MVCTLGTRVRAGSTWEACMLQWHTEAGKKPLMHPSYFLHASTSKSTGLWSGRL